jgi:CheY-like chemotaxis protein
MSSSFDQCAVLVVDDNPGVRAMAVDMLESLGLIVHDSYNGEGALRLLEEHPEITALFTDVRMPGMSGIELAREARRRRPGLKVILTSGFIGADTPSEGDVFVPKPFRLDHLAAIFSPQQLGRAS